MLVIRCTKKLLTRLGATPDPNPAASTGKLGDWYGNLIYLGRRQLVLFTAERSLVPVVVEAKPSSTLLDRFRRAVGDLLTALELPPAVIEAELKEMLEITIAKTASRTVLGMMNDFSFAMTYFGNMPLPEVALRLAETPCSPLEDVFPCDATRKLFGLPPIKSKLRRQ